MPVAVVAQVAHSHGNVDGIRARPAKSLGGCRSGRWLLLGSCTALASWLKPHDKATENTSPQPVLSVSIMPGATSTIPTSHEAVPNDDVSLNSHRVRPSTWRVPDLGTCWLMGIVSTLLYYARCEDTFPSRPCVGAAVLEDPDSGWSRYHTPENPDRKVPKGESN